MSSIVSSELVESVQHGGTKRNLYRYTLDNDEIHYRRGWIPTATDDETDMARRAATLIDELAIAEAEQVLK